jgi:hypothetical protein
VRQVVALDVVTAVELVTVGGVVQAEDVLVLELLLGMVVTFLELLAGRLLHAVAEPCLRQRRPRLEQRVLRAAIEADLPRPAVDVHVLLPYERGDLVSRIHDSGDVISTEHTGEGTRVEARVSEALAGELEPYALTGIATSDD